MAPKDEKVAKRDHRREWFSHVLILGAPVAAAAVFSAFLAVGHFLADGPGPRLAAAALRVAAFLNLGLTFVAAAAGGLLLTRREPQFVKRAAAAFGCGVFGVVLCWILVAIASMSIRGND